MRAVARSSNHGEWARSSSSIPSLHTTIDRTHVEVDRSRAPNLNPSALYSVACDHERFQDRLSFSAHARASARSAQNHPISLEVTVALPHSQSLRDMRAYGKCSGGNPAALSPRRLMRPLSSQPRDVHADGMEGPGSRGHTAAR
jgi:hypothetical protein